MLVLVAVVVQARLEATVLTQLFPSAVTVAQRLFLLIVVHHNLTAAAAVVVVVALVVLAQPMLATAELVRLMELLQQPTLAVAAVVQVAAQAVALLTAVMVVQVL
jgi:hypothetical protein